eukprot:357902-Chlamydomonas_euryale.AAC.7
MRMHGTLAVGRLRQQRQWAQQLVHVGGDIGRLEDQGAAERISQGRRRHRRGARQRAQVGCRPALHCAAAQAKRAGVGCVLNEEVIVNKRWACWPIDGRDGDEEVDCSPATALANHVTSPLLPTCPLEPAARIMRIWAVDAYNSLIKAHKTCTNTSRLALAGIPPVP